MRPLTSIFGSEIQVTCIGNLLPRGWAHHLFWSLLFPLFLYCLKKKKKRKISKEVKEMPPVAKMEWQTELSLLPKWSKHRQDIKTPGVRWPRTVISERRGLPLPQLMLWVPTRREMAQSHPYSGDNGLRQSQCSSTSPKQSGKQQTKSQSQWSNKRQKWNHEWY